MKQQSNHPGYLVVAVALVLTGCTPDGAARAQAETASTQTALAAVSPALPLSPAPVRELTPEEWLALSAAVQPLADSADRALRHVPGLTRSEHRALRRDVNDLQIQRARLLGIPPSADVAGLVQSRRLVKLAPSTRYWCVRDLHYSEPYVTPAAHAMLMEIGQRFQQQLDSLGVPRYRLDITSVLRTPAAQAELRRRNRNASRKESAHEFGTTVDIAYRRFAPPLDGEAVPPEVRLVRDSVMVQVARLRGAELQAVLGRVLLEMQREGKLMVIMERSQTVYHMTVARSLRTRAVRASME